MNQSPPPLDPPSQPSPAPQPVPPQKSGGGGWLFGCGLGCLVMLVVLLVGVFFAVKAVTNKAKDLAVQYTAEEPVEMVPPALPREEREAALARFDAFRDAVANGGQPPVLVLTDEEINTLIHYHPDFEDLAGKAHVTIEDGTIASEVSLDIDALGVPIPFVGEAIEGRYFNGEAVISLGVVGGRPVMNLEQVTVNGASPPESIMVELRKENLLEDYDQDPDMKAFFDKIEAIEVEENRLRVVPKAPGGGSVP